MNTPNKTQNDLLEYGFLYLLCILIWGSTWYAVKLQMGVVRPEISVAFRFLSASIVLFAYCFLKKNQLNFSFKNHLLFAAQGFCVFCVGYIFSYKSVSHITSGIVAVFYSLMPFFNIIYSRLIFKTPIESRVVTGAFMGLSGVAIVFSNEWATLNAKPNFLWGILFAFLGAGFGSLGNMAAVKMAKLKLPVSSWNAWGMLYGSLFTLFYCFQQKIPFVLDTRPSYWLTFGFLSLFGSIVAFGAYYKVQNKVGASRASYMTVFFPIIALMYSSTFESYKWSLWGLLGVVFVLLGNLWIIPGKFQPSRRNRDLALAS